jgi:hypothetical protein
MKIEICYDTADQITVQNLIDMLETIQTDFVNMELEDIIAMSRVAESIMGVLRYMRTDAQLNELLRQS